MSLTFPVWQEIFRLSWPELWVRLAEATQLREARFGRKIKLCVIINARSGLCSEDCAYCAQARGAQTQVAKYPLLPREKILEAAAAAHAQGAARFSVVTSGRGLSSSKEREALLEAVAALRAQVPIRLCASLGIVERSFLKELKAAGLNRYHHNLETAASHFPRICTTHSYEERLATIAAAKEAGLEVCVGGIFGLGETVAQRYELACALKDLEVQAVPINFLHPLPGTRLADRPLLSPLEALQIIVALRLMLPAASLIICGGRLPTLRSLAPLAFAAGADGLMTGDYLTTKGRTPADDLAMLADLGLEVEAGEADGGDAGLRPLSALSM
ncbi:MAG: biotin synthase BioB [Desulfobaccales bacterium]